MFENSQGFLSPTLFSCLQISLKDSIFICKCCVFVAFFVFLLDFAREIGAQPAKLL